jgi:hypothetical protein
LCSRLKWNPFYNIFFGLLMPHKLCETLKVSVVSNSPDFPIFDQFLFFLSKKVYLLIFSNSLHNKGTDTEKNNNSDMVFSNTARFRKKILRKNPNFLKFFWSKFIFSFFSNQTVIKILNAAKINNFSCIDLEILTSIGYP